MLNAEQKQFADAVTRFAQREYGVGQVRPNHHFSRERFVRLAELGCLSLAIPHDQGGLGGALEIMLAAERLAPALPHEPMIGSGVFAANLLARGATPPQAAELLTRLSLGAIVVAVAHHETASHYRADAVAAQAEKTADGWRIRGHKTLVDAAEQADAFVVSARDLGDGRLALFLVDKATPALNIIRRSRIDGLPCGDVVMEGCVVGASARLDAAPADQVLAEATDRTEAAEIASMVGLMDACIRTTTEYARTRRQFGAAIASFQAIQHRLADMWIACEETRSLAFAAACACDDGRSSDRRRAVSLAKIRACDAARLVGAETIQIHGAIGMTDELIVSHWYKRLMALRLNLGDRDHHVTRLASPALA